MIIIVGPSHRLQAQIQATARVLEIELSCMYLPDVMLISYDDGSTGTSNIKFIRQSSALDMGKLYDAFRLYWKVGILYCRSALLLSVSPRRPYFFGSFRNWRLMLTEPSGHP